MTGSDLIVRPEENLGWVAPRSFPEVKEMGEWLIKQNILPESVKTGGQAATIIMAGMEIGLRPIESFRHLYVVRGQPSMSTKLMVRLFRKAGHDYEIDEWTKDIVRGRLILRNGKRYEHELTRKECDAAHWSQDWDKEKKAFAEKHTWAGMGKVMIMYRWLSTGIRAFAPECLDGMVTIDEASDAITPDDVEYDADMIETTGVTVLSQDGDTDNPAGKHTQQITATEPGGAGVLAGATDAEYTEQASEPTVALTGNEQRPYSPEILKAVIAQKITDNTAKLGDKDATPEKQRTAVGAINKLMEQAFGKLEKDALDAARHDAMQYLLGKAHSSEWTDIECRVLLGWSQDPIVEDGNRIYAPHPDAIKEIKALVEWQAGVEQEMLPL